MSLTQINKAGLDEIALDHVFTIGALGNSSAYTFQGEGLNGTVNNPTLYLTRGKTYRFENGSGGHPIRIQSTSGASGTAYSTGVTNNAGSGTVIVEVQHDAPDVLYYQCTSHPAMNGILYITGALADGGVTTAKIADNAVTANKIATNAVTTTKLAADAIVNSLIADNAVETANIANGAVTTSKIAAGAVNTAELANNAVTNAKLGSNAVTSGNLSADSVTDTVLSDSSSDNSLRAVGTNHIKDSAVTTPKIGDGAITSAKIYDGTILTADIADHQITDQKLASNSVTTPRINGSAVTTAKIADQAVTLAKLEHGTSSNDGKFLRANNGADPTFETVTGTTINSNSNNYVVTATGTANTLQGESNLTYDGTHLTVRSGAHDGGLQIVAANNNQTTRIKLQAKHSGGSERNWFIEVPRGSDILNFFDDSHGSHTQLIDNGDLSIVDGNLSVGSGHGIDFSDTGDASGATAELLDDYEEGTWTPSITFGGNTSGQSYSYQSGRYVKVGHLVHIQCYIAFSSKGTSTGTAKIEGLPYANYNQSGLYSSAKIGYINNGSSSAGPGSISDFFVYGEVNQSVVNIYRQEMNSSTIAVNDAQDYNFADNTDLMLTMTYITN